MIVHHEQMPGGISNNRFQRENWKEYFRFPVSAQFIKEGNLNLLPKGFRPTHFVHMMNGWWFWRWYLAPFVKILLRLTIRWYGMARFCYKKQWIRVEEGSVVRWWWPLQLVGINPKITPKITQDVALGRMERVAKFVAPHRCMNCKNPKCSHFHCANCNAALKKLRHQ